MPDSGIIIATEPAESEEDWIQEETQHMGAAYKTSIRCRSLALRMLLDLQSGFSYRGAGPAESGSQNIEVHQILF